MKIFKNYTYSWWQIGIFKLTLLCFGVAIGAYWNEVFSQYLTILLVVGLVLAIYIGFVSLKD
jgi:putative Mn2+ efflux pump MntP